MTALASGPAPARIEFTTTDSALAIDNLKDVYGTNFKVSGARDGYVFAHSRLDGGSFALDELRVPLDVRVRQDPFNSLIVVLLRAGRFDRECGGIDERFLPGDVFIDAEPSLPSTVRLLHIELQTTMLDLGVLAQVAATSSSRAPGPIRFTGYQPVSPAAAAHWRNTTRYLGELLANPEAAAQPLIRGNGARMLAATALATFPNTAVMAPSGRDRSDATSATLRRAVAFIEQHAHSDINLADIAAAANVSLAPSSSPSAATATPRPWPTCARCGSIKCNASCSPPIRAATTPSPTSPPAGASTTTAGSPPSTAAPSASPHTTPCATDSSRARNGSDCARRVCQRS